MADKPIFEVEVTTRVRILQPQTTKEDTGMSDNSASDAKTGITVSFTHPDSDSAKAFASVAGTTVNRVPIKPNGSVFIELDPDDYAVVVKVETLEGAAWTITVTPTGGQDVPPQSGVGEDTVRFTPVTVS